MYELFLPCFLLCLLSLLLGYLKVLDICNLILNYMNYMDDGDFN